MLGPMASAAVYGFEAIDETLPYVPLAARRLLDALGQKLSLEGWLSLPIEDRRRLVDVGAGVQVVMAGVEAILDRAVPPPPAVEPVAEPDARAPSPELLAALGPSRPLNDRWLALRPLDRYALAKYIASEAREARTGLRRDRPAAFGCRT